MNILRYTDYMWKYNMYKIILAKRVETCTFCKISIYYEYLLVYTDCRIHKLYSL